MEFIKSYSVCTAEMQRRV